MTIDQTNVMEKELLHMADACCSGAGCLHG